MNSAATKGQSDGFLQQHQAYTLGKAAKIAAAEKLFNPPLQDELNSLLQQRNWSVHKSMLKVKKTFMMETKKKSYLIQ